MNHPKIEVVDFGTTVDFMFDVSDWSVSDFYVYLSLVFRACYHWWICLLVWYSLLFIIIIFYFNNSLIFIFILFICLFVFSFFFFFIVFWAVWLAGLWCTGLVSGLSPQGGRVKFRTLPPETSRAHIISIGESSPRDLHPNKKTQLHPTASKLQRGMPHAKKLVRQEHNPTH